MSQQVLEKILKKVQKSWKFVYIQIFLQFDKFFYQKKKSKFLIFYTKVSIQNLLGHPVCSIF